MYAAFYLNSYDEFSTTTVYESNRTLCVQSKNNWIFLGVTKLGYGSKTGSAGSGPTGFGTILYPIPRTFWKLK